MFIVLLFSAFTAHADVVATAITVTSVVAAALIAAAVAVILYVLP